MPQTFDLLTGSAAAIRLDDLATLRLEIFREFPYLYDGDRGEEIAYLKCYAETPDAFVLIVSDGQQVVGAATGMPLRCEGAELVRPFDGTAYAVEQIYYIGELLFRPACRNC